MEDGRSQDLGRDIDADNEEDEDKGVDDVDEDEEDEDEDEEDKDEENEDGEEQEEEEDTEDEDEDEDAVLPWSYPDSDEIVLYGISLTHLKERFEQLGASLVPLDPKNEVELQEGLRVSLPEDILWNILVRLPVTTQCRFRCVCSRWKLLLSAPSSAGQQVSQVESRPLCTIMSETQSSESLFYSHAEDRWYQFPFQPESCMDIEWRLEAADGGLVCYRSPRGAPQWLLVCNPITRASQIVSPCSLDPYTMFSFQHFVVDKESKSFMIVMAWARETMYFDSKTRLWTSCSGPGFLGSGFHIEDNELVRKNIFYSQFQQFDWYGQLGVKSEDCRTIEASLPCDPQYCYHIMCSKNHVMLIQLHPRKKDPIRIWKLVMEDASALWLSRWEEVAVKIPVSMRPLVDQIQGCWSQRNEFICFGTLWSHHWIKYVFATKTWWMMPCGGKSRPHFYTHYSGFYHWFHWEPCLDMDVDTVEFDSLLAVYAAWHPAFQRRRVNNAPPDDDSTGSDYGDDSHGDAG